MPYRSEAAKIYQHNPTMLLITPQRTRIITFHALHNADMLQQSLCSFISDTQFIDKQIYGITYHLGKLKYLTEMM